MVLDSFLIALTLLVILECLTCFNEVFWFSSFILYGRQFLFLMASLLFVMSALTSSISVFLPSCFIMLYYLGVKLVSLGSQLKEVTLNTQIRKQQQKNDIQLSWIKILQYNVNYKNNKKEDLLFFIQKEKPDLVFLQEANSEWLDYLLSSELSVQYFTEEVDTPEDYESGRLILSRFPIIRTSKKLFNQTNAMGIHIVIEVGSKSINLFNVHPEVPLSKKKFIQQQSDWRSLEQYVSLCKGSMILCGDFNITPWHAIFQQFKKKFRLRDAQTFSGHYPTFPAIGFFAGFFPIDNCLISGDLSFKQVQQGPHLGSDHRPLIIEIGH